VRVISTKDLDLRYDGDVYELHRRIEAVAEESCDEVERASPGVPLTTERECVREAVRDAMAQADDLVYARRG
jgi:UrcA family protein